MSPYAVRPCCSKHVPTSHYCTADPRRTAKDGAKDGAQEDKEHGMKWRRMSKHLYGDSTITAPAVSSNKQLMLTRKHWISPLWQDIVKAYKKKTHIKNHGLF